MKTTKVVLLFIAITLANINVGHASLIRTSDGELVDRSDLPFTTETVLEFDNDQLVGAFNVDVNGVGIFDVDFIDQAFNTISDFDIVATALNAGAFTSSLLDSVFVNVANFLFDDIPTSTLGCENLSVCFAFVPTSVSGSGNAVFVASAINQSLLSSQQDRVGTSIISSSNDLSLASGAVFARFIEAPTRITPPQNLILPASFSPIQDVPEPSSLLLALLGMIGLVMYRRVRATSSGD